MTSKEMNNTLRYLNLCTNRLCYYLSENYKYANHVNECVTDFAMDLVAYYYEGC